MENKKRILPLLFLLIGFVLSILIGDPISIFLSMAFSGVGFYYSLKSKEWLLMISNTAVFILAFMIIIISIVSIISL